MTETDYSKVFEVYNELPPNIKREFDDYRAKEYSKGSPPPEQMQKDLEGILAKYQPKKQSHAPASTSGIFSGRMSYAAGLATILIAVALASSGIPYVPPLY